MRDAACPIGCGGDEGEVGAGGVVGYVDEGSVVFGGDPEDLSVS